MLDLPLKGGAGVAVLVKLKLALKGLKKVGEEVKYKENKMGHNGFKLNLL